MPSLAATCQISSLRPSNSSPPPVDNSLSGSSEGRCTAFSRSSIREIPSATFLDGTGLRASRQH
eukprot:2721042-Rhodomonas_salina.1